MEHEFPMTRRMRTVVGPGARALRSLGNRKSWCQARRCSWRLKRGVKDREGALGSVTRATLQSLHRKCQACVSTWLRSRRGGGEQALHAISIVVDSRFASAGLISEVKASGAVLSWGAAALSFWASVHRPTCPSVFPCTVWSTAWSKG
eukprot:9525532-Alexandrium_andersonii.AAC.1